MINLRLKAIKHTGREERGSEGKSESEAVKNVMILSIRCAIMRRASNVNDPNIW
jgi:hypothetical protein